MKRVAPDWLGILRLIFDRREILKLDFLCLNDHMVIALSS